jgi:hypothetical protein
VRGVILVERVADALVEYFLGILRSIWTLRTGFCVG